jgi:DNA-binding MarR family transcriptional regulator
MEAQVDPEAYTPQSTHMAIMADLYLQTEGKRQQDLAVSSIKDKATIARALAQMEREGIVVRGTDPADRRNKLISLTERGVQLKQRFLPCLDAIMVVATEGLDQSDLHHCEQTLGLIYQNLQAHINAPQHDQKE